MLTGLQ